MTPTESEFWQRFLADTGREGPTEPFEVFGFGDSPALIDELLALVLEGRKTATTSLPDPDMPIPVGALSLVTDGAGNPRAVVETLEVIHLRFGDMTQELAEQEGEGDRQLATWRADHLAFFERETGTPPTDDQPIVFERFRVVYTAHPAA